MKLMLKKGNRIWVKIPTNATIISVNKRYGYTIKTDDGVVYQYFDDNDVQEEKS